MRISDWSSDVCSSDLSRADAGGRCHRHPRQSEAARMTAKLIAALRALPLSGRIGLALVVFWLAVALAGPWLAPSPLGAFVDRDVFSGVSSRFWLGSDYLGRYVQHGRAAVGERGLQDVLFSVG